MGEAERGEQRGGQVDNQVCLPFLSLPLCAQTAHGDNTGHHNKGRYSRYNRDQVQAPEPRLYRFIYNKVKIISTELSIISQNHINRIDYDKVKIISTEFTISRSNIVHIYRIHYIKVKYCSYLQNSFQRGQNMIHVSCCKCCIY